MDYRTGEISHREIENAKEAPERGLFPLPDAETLPALTLYEKQPDAVPSRGIDTLAAAVRELKRGNIVAVKGLGGFHFACSPYDKDAVESLRRLKQRDSKPFAVMFRDAAAVAELCEMNDAERALLESPARPIVLLPMKDAAFAAFADGVLRGNSRCGCFLPYTAVHKGLLAETGALVMTSANRSGSAILLEDASILRFLAESGGERFTAALLHDRVIERQLEDSVAQIADGAPQIIRWSRGYAPGAIRLENRSGRDILAMGGDLKAAFCLVKGEHAYRSQYFGDLEERSVFDRYAAGIREYERHFESKPARVLCDSHPGYASSLLAERLGLPVTRVQHHHAHIASVMAEHGLSGKVVGVAFDGTGYGDDGCIWGGEFLLCEEDRYTRAGHLGYVGLAGGDSAAKDAGKTAFCYLASDGNEPPRDLCEHGDIISAALRSGVNVAQSSSMGRLFDAVAAILGVCGSNTYEGECAIFLQQAAESALKAGTRPYPLRFHIGDDLIPDAAGLTREIYALRSRIDAAALALGFHQAVADMTRAVCAAIAERERCDGVALSGGVFQNKLLLEMISGQLSVEKLRVYTNRECPPNDGGIALGQAYLGGITACV